MHQHAGRLAGPGRHQRLRPPHPLRQPQRPLHHHRHHHRHRRRGTRLFLAASTSGNACGTYFVYTLTFTGGLFPNGALLDYPYLGQDRAAILSSTNNFNPGYINSTAWSVSKALVYSGAAVSFPAFAVAFSTAPVTVTGIPIGATANTF